MRKQILGLVTLALLAGPVSADHVQIEMIDARTLSVDQMRRMAVAEREGAEAHDCCDWGGLGCRAETLRMSVTPKIEARLNRPRQRSPLPER